VLAASHANVDEVIADYEAVKAPYHEVEVKTSDDFGAAAMTGRRDQRRARCGNQRAGGGRER